MLRLGLALLLAAFILHENLAAQDSVPLHRIHAKTPADLRVLFEFDQHRLPLLSSHRGGATAGFPENCIATFEHTLQHAYSLLEIDLRQTKDGHLVLHHDPLLDRTTSGTGPIAERTLAEVKQLRLKDGRGALTDHRIPTLDEALNWARGKTILILDKKDVPVEECVQKIREHQAQSFAMVMAYSLDDIQTCYRLDPGIMMEVMLGNSQRLESYASLGVPWNRIIAFVGHQPELDEHVIKLLHQKKVLCMAGTSRNLDRQLIAEPSQKANDIARAYQDKLDCGVDILETDLPVPVSRILFDPPEVPEAKAKYFLRK